MDHGLWTIEQQHAGFVARTGMAPSELPAWPIASPHLPARHATMHQRQRRTVPTQAELEKHARFVKLQESVAVTGVLALAIATGARLLRLHTPPPALTVPTLQPCLGQGPRIPVRAIRRG